MLHHHLNGKGPMAPHYACLSPACMTGMEFRPGSSTSERPSSTRSRPATT